MADIQTSINEVVEDLKKKVEELSKAGNADDSETLQKINAIKQKAIYVLNEASNKVTQTAEEFAESEEIEQAIEIVKIKSKELYENALQKINEISKKEVVEEAKEVAKDVKEEINNFFEKEEVKDITESVKEVGTEIADKAVSTLKEWLKPEGK